MHDTVGQKVTWRPIFTHHSEIPSNPLRKFQQSPVLWTYWLVQGQIDWWPYKHTLNFFWGVRGGGEKRGKCIAWGKTGDTKKLWKDKSAISTIWLIWRTQKRNVTYNTKTDRDLPYVVYVRDMPSTKFLCILVCTSVTKRKKSIPPFYILKSSIS